MSDGDALLAAVRDALDDDTPRLVYADWLDDHGGEPGCRHAQFIRSQVAAARATGGRCARRRAGTGAKLCDMLAPMTCGDGEVIPPTIFLHNAGGTGVVWHRGFLECAVAGPNDWLRIGHEVLRQHPALRLVHLLLRPADYFTLAFRPERFAREGDRHVARRQGWAVEFPVGVVPASGVRLAWEEIARLDAQLFFEAIFPTLSFVTDPAVRPQQYPDTPQPERMQVQGARVTPPPGVAWPKETESAHGSK